MTINVNSRSRGEAYERLVRQEELILDVTERLTEALQEAGVTKAELARRLGRTPGFVSQLLGGGRNLTLRTISDIAVALSLRPGLELRVYRAQVVDTVQEMRLDPPRCKFDTGRVRVEELADIPVSGVQYPAAA